MNAVILAQEGADIQIRGGGFGMIGAIVFTAILIASVFLVRNMNKRIKRLPESFDGEAAEPGRKVTLPRDEK